MLPIEEAEIIVLVLSANDENGAKLCDFPDGPMYHVARGRALYRLGEPCPERPSDADDGRSDGALLWMGYMLERAKDLQKCWSVKKTLEDDDPFDPRPPHAMAA